MAKTIKQLLVLTFFLFNAGQLFSQQVPDITGQWYGVLNVQGTQLRLVFHIGTSDDGYSATFDSPDQQVSGIPFSSATYEHPNLLLEAESIGGTYRAVFASDSLAGTWTQGGQNFPLTMFKGSEQMETETLNRPQEPVAPYPYRTEEVAIENSEDNLTLAGTLTIPEGVGPHPALILITGSGPQNRDEEIFGHKPFLVLADFLTREGFAVLRYDDRGFGSSTGQFATATTEDFTRDAISVVEYLKSHPGIDSGRIGLIGHSEGGIIAPMVANRSEDVAHIVLLAGTGISGKEVVYIQVRTMRELELPDEDAYLRMVRGGLEIASSDKELPVLREELTAYLRGYETAIRPFLPAGVDFEAYINQDVAQSLSPWIRYFYNYNPADELEKINVPVLALFGSNDRQVTPAENLPAVESALERSGNDNWLVKELPGLNHMFQESQTGYVSEYSQIEQTLSPLALEEIVLWLNSLP